MGGGALQRGPDRPWSTQNVGWVGHGAFDPTYSHILRQKCTKFAFRWGSDPDQAGGAYSAPPDRLAVF